MPRGKLALVLVSTIIPVFNGERTIAQTIESALAQRYDNHEIVIVDDGSTDATARILERYRDRFRIVNQNNRGAAAARNAGIAHSNGEYLAFLDSDDLFLPNKVAVMTAALRQNSAASLAFSEYGFIDGSGTEYRESAIGDVSSMPALMKKSPFPIASLSAFIYPSTWLVPRRVLARTGGFNEAFKGAGYEDSWLLLLLRELGDFVYVPDKLTLYRDPLCSSSGQIRFRAASVCRYGEKAIREAGQRTDSGGEEHALPNVAVKDCSSDGQWRPSRRHLQSPTHSKASAGVFLQFRMSDSTAASPKQAARSGPHHRAGARS